MANNDGNQIDRNQLAKMTAAEFAQKFPTKKDTWRFITTEVKWYLPHHETVTIWHMRDLLRNERTHIK